MVGKLMVWSERSQTKLGSWWVELHWRLSTGPTRHPEHTLCSHSQCTLLGWKTHMWTVTLSHATSSALYQMISFRLLSFEHPARIEPYHWGWYLQALFRIQNFLNIIPSLPEILLFKSPSNPCSSWQDVFFSEQIPPNKIFCRKNFCDISYTKGSCYLQGQKS